MSKTIAFVPARGGSVSIPLKNIKDFCGKPLIYWSLSQLQITDEIDEIWVATDSKKIEDVVDDFGFSKVKIFHRNTENAQNHSSTESVMIEFIRSSNLLGDYTFVLVQLTSPLTTKKDFELGLKLFKNSNYDSVLSGVKSKRFFWAISGEPINYDFKNRPRRQDFEGVVLENGAFYINKVENIVKDENRLSGKVGIVEMPEFTSVELDEQIDWEIAEAYMKDYVIEKNTLPKKRIDLLATDVDGVLTDAGMYYSENGDELKKFNTRDGKGFELLRNTGIKTAIITSENTDIVMRRAKKLKIDYLYQGLVGKSKLEAVKEICERESINVDNVAYIGDDINCKEVLVSVGLAACPYDAQKEIKNIKNIIVLPKKGGDGVVRYFIDNHIFSNG